MSNGLALLEKPVEKLHVIYEEICQSAENQNEISNKEKYQTDVDDTGDLEIDSSEDIERLISELPQSFPLALPKIKGEIGPLLEKCELGLVEHYVTMIKKQTKAATIKAVRMEIEDAREKRELEETDEVEKDEGLDPEVLELVEEIKIDPLLFKNRIDFISTLGVVGEKHAIGLNFLAMDSRLIPMGVAGSEALALKNSGIYGAGKSYPLFMCKELYSPSAYHLVTSGSSKSLYNIAGGLKHKALILTEALQLQADNSRGDNELAYSIRSLVSEGSLAYQYTGYNEDGKKVTIITKMEGPTSLLTTTIKGRLEPQLEDRLISVSPNTSNKQTQNILEKTARLANGTLEVIDENVIKAWREFHDSLESLDVVIPFAEGIVDYVKQNESLPVSTRRGFKRVLAGIKTVALTYQHQRKKDDQSRIIAEMSDYCVAYQLLDESFRESAGQRKRYPTKRFEIIEREGVITPGKLAEMAGISAAALSPWIKKSVEKGELVWVDKNNVEFVDEQSLQTAKHSGNAYIRITNACGLPTPFQLSGDPLWDDGGELFVKYDLKIDKEMNEETAESDFEFTDLDGEFEVEDLYDNAASGVNVFDRNPGFEINLLKDQGEEPSCENDDIGERLLSEFDRVLSPVPGLETIQVTTA